MQIDSPSILAESFEGNVDQYGMLPIYETFRTLLYASASCCSNTYNLEYLNIEQPNLALIYRVGCKEWLLKKTSFNKDQSIYS